MRAGAHYARPEYQKTPNFARAPPCWAVGSCWLSPVEIKTPTGWRLSAGSMAPASGGWGRHCCDPASRRRWRWRAGRTGRIVCWPSSLESFIYGEIRGRVGCAGWPPAVGPTLLRPGQPAAGGELRTQRRVRESRTGRIVEAVEVLAVRPGILHLRRNPGR